MRRDLALIAGFAALIAICSLLPAIEVKGIPVPITLQTLGIMLSAACLGPVRGPLAVLLYVLCGLAGLPIFSGWTGGLETLSRPSVGYIVSWPFAAALTGWLVQRIPRQRFASEAGLTFLCGMAGSLCFIHPLGIAGMALRLDLPLTRAIELGATFLPGDVVKNTLMALSATTIHRAFPALLPRPGARRRV
ncbi:MAG: biotin transporter BioY [Myxococcaceae bacterium]